MISRRVLLIVVLLLGFGGIHSVFGSMGEQVVEPLGQPDTSAHGIVLHDASLAESGENTWYRRGALLAGVAAVSFTFLFAAAGSKSAAAQR